MTKEEHDEKMEKEINKAEEQLKENEKTVDAAGAAFGLIILLALVALCAKD